MKFSNKLKKLLILVILTAVLGAVMMGVDYWRVCTHNKPLFAFCINGYDDGGSGRYIGMGYTMDIQGNFMPEDEFPGVTHAEIYIFGNRIVELFVTDHKMNVPFPAAITTFCQRII